MNAGGTGDVDIVLRIDGTLYPVDVKASIIGSDGNWRASNNCRVSKDVWAVNVDPNDDGYEIRWPNKHGYKRNQKIYNCPPGLEDFWD